MPVKGAPQHGSITWEDVARAVEEHEREYHCKIEFGVGCYRPNPKLFRAYWEVSCFARSRPGQPTEIRAVGRCRVGGNNGAATHPGAYLRAVFAACKELEERRASKALDRDMGRERLPGM